MAPSWASWRIGGAHLVVASCCFGGRIRVKSLALPLGSPRAFPEHLVIWCAHNFWRDAGVLLVVGAFVHSQNARREAGGLVLLCPCVERPRALMLGGGVFSVRPFQCLLSSFCGCTSALLRVGVGGPAPGPCLLWQHGWVHSVHPSRCAQSGLGVVAGVLGGDAGSMLVEDGMQALFGGPLTCGVAARSWRRIGPCRCFLLLRLYTCNSRTSKSTSRSSDSRPA